MTKQQLTEGNRLSHEIEFLDSIIKILHEQESKVVLHHKSGESIVIDEDKISLNFKSVEGNFSHYTFNLVDDILRKVHNMKQRLEMKFSEV
jgi:hypothetical protein